MPRISTARGVPRGNRMKVRNPMKTLGRLLGYIFKRYWAMFLFVFVCIGLSSFASVMSNAMIGNIIDAIEKQLKIMKAGGVASYDEITRIIYTVILIFSVGCIALWVYNRTMVYISQHVLRQIRVDMFDKMQTLPVKYFDTHTFGETMSHFTNDTDTLEQFISNSIPQIINSFATIIICIIVMLIYSWQLTLVVFATIFLMFFVIKNLGGKSARYFSRQQTAYAELDGYIEEMLSGQKVVKVFCYEDRNKKAFNEINNDYCHNLTNANKYSNIFMPIMANLTYVQYALIALIGAILFASGNLILKEGQGALALISIFLGMSRTFTRPINMVSQQFNSIVMALAGAERIFDLMDEQPETDNGYVTLVRGDLDGETFKEDEKGKYYWKHPHSDSTLSYVELKGNITLNQVDFSYDGKKQVLTDITIYAKSGQKIALIGKTGTGKTTISNLINRFYDIDDGKIRYDGININKIKKADLRRSLGVVLQEVNLFTDTVRENIRYGNPTATDEEVYAAAKLSRADEFIKRLPDGYDTILTGNGANLSQGQRQLISIARVAIANPPVMILDEATSSIDTRTEILTQQGMDNLMNGRTVFVIAHRLSTIKNSDCIMVMDGGKIIERGNHDELMAKQGVYYSMNAK